MIKDAPRPEKRRILLDLKFEPSLEAGDSWMAVDEEGREG